MLLSKTNIITIILFLPFLSSSRRNENCDGQGSNKVSIRIQNLLLLLPEIRQSDSVIRQFWLDTRNGKQQLGGRMLPNHSTNDKKDPISIPMNKLLVEMLEAGIECCEPGEDGEVET